MQGDPEVDEGPQQHGEDCRGDRLQHVEMLEVMMSSRHDHADDDVDNERQAPSMRLMLAPHP
jgi:hypothetical protein